MPILKENAADRRAVNRFKEKEAIEETTRLIKQLMKQQKRQRAEAKSERNALVNRHIETWRIFSEQKKEWDKLQKKNKTTKKQNPEIHYEQMTLDIVPAEDIPVQEIKEKKVIMS